MGCLIFSIIFIYFNFFVAETQHRMGVDEPVGPEMILIGHETGSFPILLSCRGELCQLVWQPAGLGQGVNERS